MDVPSRGRPRKVAVVGAGVTGLTAAWRLQQAGCEVQVFEALDHPGGRTRSVRKDGFVFDVGAITLLPTYKRTLALLDELGQSGNVHAVAPVIGIPRDGKVHRIEVAHALRSLLQTTLVSRKAKLRLLRLLPPLLKAWNKAHFETLTPLARWDDQTIAAWSRAHLGEEVLNYIIDPIIRGNTLNGTEDAPLGELFWMLRQYAAPCLYGTDGGIDLLARVLAERLDVRYAHRVLSVERQDGRVSLTVQSPNGSADLDVDACVLALPPAGLLSLAPTLTTAQRASLAALRPLPSINVHLGLSSPPTATETFILPPPSEHPVLTTIVQDHRKAPGRAPAGKAVVSLFCRDTWSAAQMENSDEAILADVMAMARPWLGELAPLVESWHVQRWDYAIAKSGVGLYQQLAAWEAEETPDTVVQLAGDFLSMGMEAAVIAGERAARRLMGAGST